MATSSAAAHNVVAQNGRSLSERSSLDDKSARSDPEKSIGGAVAQDLNGHSQGVSRIEALCE